MEYSTLTKLIDNERKNTKEVRYTSVAERWKDFNVSSENISDLDKNIKNYLPSVKKEIYEAIEKGAWK